MTINKQKLPTGYQAKNQELDAAVIKHSTLVKRIACHLLARLPASVQLDDLIQAGMIGLIEACRNYDASQGARFETYAGIRIRGSMLDDFDVVMVGFNLLNPCARKTVFPLCIEKRVATQIMFAVRRALSNHDALLKEIATLIDNGQVNAESVDRDNPLGFLENHPDVQSVVQAAYRFCRHEPGVVRY